MNLNKAKSNTIMSNPLFLIIILILILIIVLAFFKSSTPILSFGINANIGDIRGSFEIEAFDNSSDSNFVMYYAEWCGHCKRTMPEFKKLIEGYNGNIKIMAIDSESPENAQLIKSQKISGFPTIRYYPTGLSNKYDEYTGGRTYSDFVQYLGSIEGTPDQAPDQAAPY